MGAKLKDFLQTGYIHSCLAKHGFEDDSKSHVQRLFSDAASLLLEKSGLEENEVKALWVPGRLEFLGKHVDYAGGRSIVAALQRGFAFIALKHPGKYLSVIDGQSGQHVRIHLESNKLESTLPWGQYIQTVVERVQKNFFELPEGGTICFSSNLPSASGLSSSSALVTGLFLSLDTLFDFGKSKPYQGNIRDLEELADYLGHVENGHSYKHLMGNKGVGTLGGSQDHTAILCSAKNTLRVFSYKPIRMIEEVTLPRGVSLCIASSGVRAEKTRNAKQKYNACSLLIQQILTCVNLSGGNETTLEHIVAGADFSFERMIKTLDTCGDSEKLLQRFYHYYYETREIIPDALSAFKNRDFDALRKVANRSQVLAETYLKNQVDETSFLASAAVELGAIASSAFGAGFGGSVWSLVEKGKAETFREAWNAKYTNRYPEHKQSAYFFIDNTGPPAGMVSI